MRRWGLARVAGHCQCLCISTVGPRQLCGRNSSGASFLSLTPGEFETAVERRCRLALVRVILECARVESMRRTPTACQTMFVLTKQCTHHRQDTARRLHRYRNDMTGKFAFRKSLHCLNQSLHRPNRRSWWCQIVPLSELTDVFSMSCDEGSHCVGYVVLGSCQVHKLLNDRATKL